MKLPGFVVRMSQKFQQPLKRSETMSEKESNQEKDEEKKQLKLWRENPAWVNREHVVTVTREKGSVSHLKIELRWGLPPEVVFDLIANQKNLPYTLPIKGEVLRLQNRSRKVLKKEGEKEMVEVKQDVAWNLWGLIGTYPMTLIAHEDRKHLTAKYKKEKMMFLETFEGSWKVEPLLIDDRMCKPFKPKTRQEYKKCSKGRGRTASKVTFDQYFKPTLLLNVPPFSSYIRKITIDKTREVIGDLQMYAQMIQENFLPPLPTRIRKSS